MTIVGIISALVVGLVIGIIAALPGTAIARSAGYADTPGFDWLELITQVVLAAIGVSLASVAYGRRRKLMH